MRGVTCRNLKCTSYHSRVWWWSVQVAHDAYTTTTVNLGGEAQLGRVRRA